MKRRGKIIATITTMCLAFAMLVVGVLAAQTVSMEIGGTVTYKVEDVMCNFTTSLFCADNNTLVTDAGLYNEMVKLTDTTLDINDESVTLPTNIVRSGRFTTVSKSSYDIQTSTFNSELDVDGLDLVLGKYDSSEEEASRKSYSYYIVIEIENLADNNVNVSVTPDISNITPENVRNILINENITVGARETKRVVIGYSLETLTKAVSDTDFNYIVEAKSIDVPVLEVETFHKSSTLQDLPLENQTFTCTTQAGTLAGGSALISFSVEDIPEGYNYLKLKISDSVGTAYPEDNYGMYVDSKEDLPTNLEDAMTLLNDSSNSFPISPTSNVSLDGENVYFFCVLIGIDNSLTTLNITAQKILMAVESKKVSGSQFALEDCFVESFENIPAVLVNCTLSNIAQESLNINIPSVMMIAGIPLQEDQSVPKSVGQAYPILVMSETIFNGETTVVVPLTSKYADNSLKISLIVLGEFTEVTADISLSATYGESISNQSEYVISHYIIGDIMEGYMIDGYSGSEANIVLPSYYVDETNTAHDVIGIADLSNNTNLESVVLPDTIKYISVNAFSGCTNLSDISIGNSITHIRSNCFADTAYYNNAENWENDVLYLTSRDGTTKYLLEAKTTISGEYSIVDKTKVVAEKAFYECHSLASVNIPGSVISIESAAFCDCDGLLTVNFSEGLKFIGSQSFIYCEKLTNLIIPDSVTSIGQDAFNYCNSLSSIYMKHESSSELTLGSSWSGNATVYYYSETQKSGYWHYDENNNPVLW